MVLLGNYIIDWRDRATLAQASTKIKCNMAHPVIHEVSIAESRPVGFIDPAIWDAGLMIMDIKSPNNYRFQATTAIGAKCGSSIVHKRHPPRSQGVCI
jgi:hypothetical protein